MNDPKVSIIIPVYNEERYLGYCLKSVFSVDYPKSLLEVIVVDNGSTDRSLNIAKSYPAKVLEAPNVKIGEVRNYGANSATGDYLFFIDGDCVLPENWIKTCLELFLSSGKKVLGGGFYLRKNPYWVEKYWILDPKGDNFQQKTLAGACIAIDKDVFKQSRGFSSTLTAGEDTELSERLSNMGFQPYMSSKINITHLGFPITVKDFFRRQAWHASDYCDRFSVIFRDKVFTATVIYTIIFMMLILFTMKLSPIAIAFLIGFIMLPSIFSIKRIRRAKIKKMSMKDFFLIYTLDTIYIIARSYSLTLGLAKKFKRALLPYKA